MVKGSSNLSQNYSVLVGSVVICVCVCNERILQLYLIGGNLVSLLAGEKKVLIEIVKFLACCLFFVFSLLKQDFHQPVFLDGQNILAAKNNYRTRERNH